MEIRFNIKLKKDEFCLKPCTANNCLSSTLQTLLQEVLIHKPSFLNKNFSWKKSPGLDDQGNGLLSHWGP